MGKHFGFDGTELTEKGEVFVHYLEVQGVEPDASDGRISIQMKAFEEKVYSPLRAFANQELIEDLVEAAIAQVAEQEGIEAEDVTEEHVDVAAQDVGRAVVYFYFLLHKEEMEAGDDE